jgi:hypothetical protein
VVDSGEAWADHYRWYPQHPLTRRSRFTLKADPEQSFQAQASDGDLIDIVPLLGEHGITPASLRAGMHAGTGSQPMTILVPAAGAVTRTLARARTILRGPELPKIRLDNPDLQSPAPDGDMPSDGAPPASSHSHRCGC